MILTLFAGIEKEEKDKESPKIDEALRTIFKFERKLLPLLRKDEPLKVDNMIQIVRVFLEEMLKFYFRRIRIY